MLHRNVVAAWLLCAGPVAAQELPRATIAADAGVAIPLGEFRRDGAQPGWSVGATGTLRIAGPLAVYVSAERTTFGVENPPAGVTADRWTDTGLGGGLRLWGPVSEGRRWVPWVQIGVGWHDTDPPISAPDFADMDTSGIVTLEGGAGIDIGLAGGSLFLRPTARYRRYGYELASGAGTLQATVSALTLALGVVMPVGGAYR